MFPLPPLPSINISLGGNQGINNNQHCPQGPRHGRGGPMMRMMEMMMDMMSRMMGGQQGQQGGCCCHQGRPNFGQGFPMQNQGGVNINIGSSMRGFLG